MHILHYSPHAGGHMHDWHQAHFIDELVRAGHQVTVSNPLTVLGRTGSIAEYSEILVDEARRISRLPGPHMFFTLSSEYALDSSAVDSIRRLGMPCVIASTDDLVAPFQVRNIGPHFDLFWSTYLGGTKLLEKYGCRVIYMPMAANPHFFLPRAQRRSHSLCFVGTNSRSRPFYISALARADVPLTVRGAGWMADTISHNRQPLTNPAVRGIGQVRVGFEYLRWSTGRKLLAGAVKKRICQSLGRYRPPALEGRHLDVAGPLPTFYDMVACYSHCSASLGVVEAGSTFMLRNPVVLYHLREFEATMMACAHIVRRGPDLERCFEADKEIIFYGSIEECVDKARFYLAPERYDLCRSIGERARAHAVGEHTWLLRFQQIWKCLGLNPTI
jgi:hypothetical protein